MSDDALTKTFVDPETDKEDEVTFPRAVNGWRYNPESHRAAIVWEHPDDARYSVCWEKTGGYAWSAWIAIPGIIPRNTIYTTLTSPQEALSEAKRIMRQYSPVDAADADW